MNPDGFVNPGDDELRQLLLESQTVAVVGLSDKPARPSFTVASYLQRRGYRIIPVNPRLQEVLGEECYSSLEEIPGRVDLVDVFRRPEEVDGVVDQLLARGIPALWLQEGVVNASAAERAREAGLSVVMDRCMLKEHRRLLG